MYRNSVSRRGMGEQAAKATEVLAIDEKRRAIIPALNHMQRQTRNEESRHAWHDRNRTARACPAPSSKR